jgi:hypothetical protein
MGVGVEVAVETALEEVGDVLSKATKRLEQFLAFVKTFEEDQFPTIYCEREWRATEVFRFTPADVAMIVLPRDVEALPFYEEFVSAAETTLGLPRSIPIVPWEDLIEH